MTITDYDNTEINKQNMPSTDEIIISRTKNEHNIDKICNDDNNNDNIAMITMMITTTT